MKKIKIGDKVKVKKDNIKVDDFYYDCWYEIEDIFKIKGKRGKCYKLKDSKYSIFRKDIKERRRADEII